MLLREVPDQWQPRTRIDVVPFAGVMFVLLLVAFVMTPSMTGCYGPTLPRASTAQPVPDGVLTIGVDPGGLYWMQDETDPGPIPANRLAERLRQSLARRPGEPRVVHLRADRGAPYASVVPVLRAARDAGIRRVGLLAELPRPPR